MSDNMRNAWGMLRQYTCPHCEEYTQIPWLTGDEDVVTCRKCGKVSVFVEAQKDGPHGFTDASYLEIPQDPRLVPAEEQVRMESDD